ncbi:conserved hypothetical protein, partial [Ricinus communis]
MGGFKRRIITPDFRGGEVTSIMGGCDLDLRQSDLTGDAVVTVYALFGGITIKVPVDWTVILEGTPIMGGFEEKTVPPAANGKRLICATDAGAVVHPARSGHLPAGVAVPRLCAGRGDPRRQRHTAGQCDAVRGAAQSGVCVRGWPQAGTDRAGADVGGRGVRLPLADHRQFVEWHVRGAGRGVERHRHHAAVVGADRGTGCAAVRLCGG